MAQGARKTLVVAGFSGQDVAKETLDRLRESVPSDYAALDAFAVIAKDTEGATTLVAQKKGELKAEDVIGSVVGIVHTPEGTRAGVMASAEGKSMSEMGVPREAIDRIKQNFKPDTSLALALVDDAVAAQVLADFRQNASMANQYALEY